MADLTKLRDELGNYWRANQKQIRPWIYKDPELTPYMRKVTKVKGEYPAINSVVDHVVQGFQAEWNEMGTIKVTPNILRSYHQKVNFPLIPSQIESSWIAELNDKNLTPSQRPFSAYVVENDLKPRVIEDIEELMVTGEYDAADLATFGKAMNGVLRVLYNGIADEDNPMFRILLSEQPDDTNIVDVVTEFEKKVPSRLTKKVKNIYMSKWLADAYKLKYEDLYGTKITYSEDKKMLTRLNDWKIIPVSQMNGSNLIWTTPEGNFLQLRDDENPPAITDMQVQDYKLKIFMEFWLGVGFWSNQMVMVSTYSGGSGLVADHSTYFGD